VIAAESFRDHMTRAKAAETAQQQKRPQGLQAAE
jgi:hypothetical protein